MIYEQCYESFQKKGINTSLKYSFEKNHSCSILVLT